MTRDTSIAIYQELEASGFLTKKRLEVAKDISLNSPTTSAETWRRCARNPAKFTDSYRQRFIELEERGIAEIVGERKCRVTGKLSNEWSFTGKPPHPPIPRPTKAEIERQACTDIALAVAAEARTNHGKRAAEEIAKRIRERVSHLRGHRTTSSPAG